MNIPNPIIKPPLSLRIINPDSEAVNGVRQAIEKSGGKVLETKSTGKGIIITYVRDENDDSAVMAGNKTGKVLDISG